MNILVPISLGELYDKISILLIKKERIIDSNKLQNIESELNLLQDIAEKYDIDGIYHTDLYNINNLLWDIEDEIREKERNKIFDKRFVELARSIYQLNDKRAKVKREINEKYGSNIVEEKSYEKY